MASAGPSGMQLGLYCRYCPSPCSQMLMPVMSPLSFQCKCRQAAVFISRPVLLCMIGSTVYGVCSSWCLGA